jgi:hypothetical protein
LLLGDLAMDKWGDEGGILASLAGLITVFVLLLVVLP